MLGVARLIDNYRRMVDALHTQDMAQRRAHLPGAI
jgi:hypothetical protein